MTIRPEKIIEISVLRSQGKTYEYIAKAVGADKNTVMKYCFKDVNPELPDKNGPEQQVVNKDGPNKKLENAYRKLYGEKIDIFNYFVIPILSTLDIHMTFEELKEIDARRIHDIFVERARKIMKEEREKENATINGAVGKKAETKDSP